MKELPVAERLIVALDYPPMPTIVPRQLGRVGTRAKVLQVARSLVGTGVILKVNSILRAVGYDLIDDLHTLGFKVFADLKIFDVDKTTGYDGKFLGESRPELLTVSCVAGLKALRAIKAELPHTEVLGVAALTTLTNEDTESMFECSTLDTVLRLAKIVRNAPLDGMISGATEVPELTKEGFGIMLSFNTPAIRPLWSLAPGSQNPERVMTPTKAIMAGADRIVVGDPVTCANDPVEAAGLLTQEISAALAARNIN
ncbi:MAG TPA: orotidine 5'-phosphate decarboxylase / HUMPS family protein [Candidatus Paceibacterota bacterium]|nr:orotidine 5'-phosphate decarboxylase / HUMPS family protein [Candidatus Paceibacterota bacterium]